MAAALQVKGGARFGGVGPNARSVGATWHYDGAVSCGAAAGCVVVGAVSGLWPSRRAAVGGVGGAT